MQSIPHITLALVLTIGLNLNIFAETSFDSDEFHSPFSELLRENVDNGEVNYTAFKNNSRFNSYLDALAKATPEMLVTNSEKLAFWINAYNALAIKGIVDGLSPSSFFGRVTYFKTTDYALGGKSINLYDLERDIIIPFNEPRIHFAIICASMSCPKLRSEAYLAANLEQQLHENAIDFINDAQKNRFETNKKRAQLSKIFDWFEKDFKKHSGSVQKYVTQYVQDDSLKQSLQNNKFRRKHLKYDWNLNGTFEK